MSPKLYIETAIPALTLPRKKEMTFHQLDLITQFDIQGGDVKIPEYGTLGIRVQPPTIEPVPHTVILDTSSCLPLQVNAGNRQKGTNIYRGTDERKINVGINGWGQVNLGENEYLLVDLFDRKFHSNR